MNKVLITQSNYIPWKGYFDAIQLTDTFVVYDDMQYTKRDWRNRNKVKTKDGLKWLTIPVQIKGNYYQKIKDTKISDPRWNRSHWEVLKQNYKDALCFSQVKDFVENLYMTADSEYLTEINVHFLRHICEFLKININCRMSSEFHLHEDRNQRLVDICLEVGGTDYYSGPSAKAYMELEKFTSSNINVHFFDYNHYPEYHQLHPPYEHGVSILDLIFNEGTNATKFLKFTRKGITRSEGLGL